MEKPFGHVCATFRDFLLRLFNKEFLIFLFFLLLSGVFWLIMTLNESMERDISVPVEIVNVPEDVVITSDIHDTIKVTLRDKGYTMGAYFYGQDIQPLKVNFANYAKADGHATVSNAEMQRLLRQQLYKSTEIVAVKPEKMDLYFNHGTHKKVPVVYKGRVTAAHNYYVTRIQMEPDSVTVYALNSTLEKIDEVSTEYLSLSELNANTVKDLKLERITGVKTVPSQVKVDILVDILTEKTIEVPITAVNMPEGKVLRTFPSVVKVTMVAGSQLVDEIRASDFRVEVDYHDIEKSPSERCSLHLTAIPAVVNRATMEIEQVDYLIEQK